MSLILVLGGVRSGKSAFAERLALQRGKERVLYLATGQAWDDEMQNRIRLHQKRRPAGWTTCEEPLALDKAAERLDGVRVVLVDSLSGWIANLLMSRPEAEWHTQAVRDEIAERTEALLAVCRRSPVDWILVSDETGLGGVAATPLGRAFQDAAGWANQLAAAQADEVYFVAAGIPMRWKGGTES